MDTFSEPRVTRATALAAPDKRPSRPRGGSRSARAELINALSANVVHALEALQFPAFIFDNDRRVRWQNAAATALVGDLRGKLDRTFVAPEDLGRVRDAFVRKQMGARYTPSTRRRWCAPTGRACGWRSVRFHSDVRTPP